MRNTYQDLSLIHIFRAGLKTIPAIVRELSDDEIDAEFRKRLLAYLSTDTVSYTHLAIDKRMEQLMEERNTLITLMAKGFLEPALFNQERNVLDGEMKNLSTEKTNLVSNSASGILRANEIKDLIDYVSADNFNGDYTEELFEEFVENIIVNSRDELTFNLKCGLSLKEKVVR